jgi:hypothetical protein
MAYSPSDLVRQMHECPHFNLVNNHLERADNQFGMYDGNYWNNYSRSLLPLPIIIASIGTLAVLILVFCLIFRCWCEECKCGPEDFFVGTDKELLIASHMTWSSYLTRTTVAFSVLVVAVIQTTFFGSDSLDEAMYIVSTGMSFIYSAFFELKEDGASLVAMGQDLSTNVTAAINSGCLLAELAVSELATFNQSATSFSSAVNPLPDYIHQTKQDIRKYGVQDKNVSIWSIYVVTVATAVTYLVGLLLKHKKVLQADIGFSIVLMQILILFCAVEMVILVSPVLLLFAL